MCFTDVQKAYDTVDRKLLWQVLTRIIRVPSRMIAAIQHFHDVMGGFVRPDDGICSDWFEVRQGLRQECVLSALLFNTFFAAVLTVVLQRFSEDAVILAELVHLKEPLTSMEPNPAKVYIRRAVWGILYVNCDCIVSRSPKGLAKMVRIIVEVCRAFVFLPTESSALPQASNGKGRGNRGPSVWMQYVNPSPVTLRQSSHRTPPGLAPHHRGTAQETRPSDDLVQPCPGDNPR